MRSVTVWEDAATWAANGVRREVFFFPSGPHALYGSLRTRDPRTRPLGVVVCSSWGSQADFTHDIAHGLAHAAVRRGGAGVTFHQPGYGDSHGLPDRVAIEDLVDAAADAVQAAAARAPGLDWILAGLMLGASVATLAARRVDASGLLLVQPELDPPGYFRELRARARRVSLGREQRDDFAFGYPVPEAIAGRGPECAAEVRSALEQHAGAGAVVRYRDPPAEDAALERFPQIAVDGTWRLLAKQHPGLLEGALRGLDAVADQAPGVDSGGVRA